jgi:hypothetical protein
VAPPPRKRPFGVVIRAALVILVGAVMTVFATILVLAVLATGSSVLLVPVILFLILSLIVLAAGIGLYNLRPWAWWLAMIALSLQFISALAASGFGWNPIFWANLGWLIPGLSLVYLLAVRKQFR